MQVNLPGLHPVRRKLADGSYRYHYYAWRGKGAKAIKARPVGSPAFIAEYHKHVTERDNGDKLAALIDKYIQSPEGQRGGTKTISERQRYMQIIRNEFGEMRLIGLSSRLFRGEVFEWRDEYADRPKTADNLYRQLNRFLSWSHGRGYIEVNPLIHVQYEALYKANRASVIWTHDALEGLVKSSTREFGWLCRAVIHVGARKMDMTRLKWSNVKGGYTTFKPSKGARYNRQAKIPHTPYFQSILAEIPRQSIFVFTNTHGQPWTETAINSAFRRARADMGLENIHFHDLRGTCATIKASQPHMTVVDLAKMMGWSLNETQAMIDKYVSWGDVHEDWSWAINGM